RPARDPARPDNEGSHERAAGRGEGRAGDQEMTIFIDLRAGDVGGLCAHDAAVWQDGKTVSGDGFADLVPGQDLVLATHGFNVHRASGKQSLSDWEELCTLRAGCLFVGVLWPGDSKYLPVLDYPAEGDEAITSGRLLSKFLNDHASGAASVSFASHSLGGRMVLETLAGLNRRARRLVLMAGAIENDRSEERRVGKEWRFRWQPGT